MECCLQVSKIEPQSPPIREILIGIEILRFLPKCGEKQPMLVLDVHAESLKKICYRLRVDERE